MTALPTKIITDLLPDIPLNQNATRFFDKTDRQYIDTQILGCQQHLSDSLLNGTLATWARVASTSATLAKGDVVCVAGVTSTELQVTLASSVALAAAGAPYGVALDAATPGARVRVATIGALGPSVTGLAATAGMVRVSSAGRPERVAAFVSTDYQLGSVNSLGYLTLAIALTSAGATGGTPFIQGGNSFGATAVLGTNDAQTLALETNNTSWLFILSSGFIGVGQPTPTAPFHVDTNAANSVPVLRLENTAGDIDLFRTDATPEGALTGSIGDLADDGTGGAAYIKESGSATNTGWRRLLTSTTGFVPGGNSFGSTARLGTNDAFGIEFETNGTLAGTIDSSQRWGIGTTPGTYKFRIRNDNTGIHAAAIENIADGADSHGLLIQAGANDGTGNGHLITFRRPDGTEIGYIVQTDVTSIALNGTGSINLRAGGTSILEGSSAEVAARVPFVADSNAANTTAIITVENTAGNYQIFRTDATPEGAVTGSVGDDATDTTGGVKYSKLTGTATNTGWRRYLFESAANEHIFGASSTSATLARFLFPGGPFAAASATPQCLTVTKDCTAIAMRVDITTAGTGTGGSNTFTYVLCTVTTGDVVTATALTVTLDGDVRFGSASAEVSLPAGTRITFRVTPAGTVTSWTNATVTLGVR